MDCEISSIRFFSAADWKPPAIEKDRALAVIPGFHEPESFSGSKYPRLLARESLQISAGDLGGARIGADQLFKSMPAVSRNHGENLLGNRKDSPLAFLWEAIVKDSRLKRAGNILLDQNISCKKS